MKIALLTCDKLADLLPSDQLLIPELAKQGVFAKAEIWDDESVNWLEYDYLIFRNTWDYFEKEVKFNKWLSKIEKLGIPTLNSIAIIQENKHKFYLREMENKGFKIIPTIFIDKTANLNLLSLIPHDWQMAVIKPAFSGGAYQTLVFKHEETDEINNKYKSIASEKDLLLQKFMPEINTIGETSFIFFDKIFSHCVIKKPAAGDFRVQVQFGGNYAAVIPEIIALETAQQIVDQFSGDLLYARVDGIIINGELHLMEVECIEPDLYFTFGEGSLQRFVSSILQLINN